MTAPKVQDLTASLARREATIAGLRSDLRKAANRERVLRRRAEALAPTIERLEKVSASLSALRPPPETTVHVDVPELPVPVLNPWWKHFVAVAMGEARAGAQPESLGAALDRLDSAVDQLQGRVLSLPAPGQMDPPRQGRQHPFIARDLVSLAGLALFYVELINRGDL